jgi:hypothetical protein
MMSDLCGSYPISVIEFDFDCLPAPVEVLVLASARHFGVLVPLTTLPEITAPHGISDAYEVLFQGVIEMFDALALDYTEAAEENGCTLILPDCDRIGCNMTGEFLELSGKIGAGENSPEAGKELVLSGEYFFITESGVDISEFLVETDDGTPRVLH